MTAGSESVAHLDALLPLVSAERMAATVTALASAEFTGRRVGTAGGAAARAWLVAHLADLGAAVDTDDFPVRNVPELYAAPAVVWGEGETSTRLTFGREVAVHSTSADTSEVRRGPLGVAGSNDPTGRWLVVPAGGNPLDAARDASGAAGLLVSRAVDADGWQYTVLAGPDPGPLPILTLDAGTHRAVLAAATSAGWWSANTPLRRRDVTGANIHARFPAAEPGGIEVLLTAHYDGVGDHPGLRQPGASDNASGVAVVLEAARILAAARPAGVGVAVALLDAEEVGALGSAHHSQQLQSGDVRPLVINIDGAGLLDQAAAVEAGGPAPALLALLDQAGRHTGLPLAAGPVASDNRRYAAAGLAAVGIGAGMAGYHSPADTPDRVDPHTLKAIARLVVATVHLAASAPATLSSPIGDKR
ncbi:M28 family metallopeptidase [Micromonospora foliorum]|uniref:M28 family metallopeptidase n=1 Tax=Micromonospora foliorum TaxID=2911210 RepID=UPI001EE83D99|nr:M28 family peptidase [Micromonospora foliorum]MCG5437492.1 M28 family metallopeptidase [Micromonospora foliorum]